MQSHAQTPVTILAGFLGSGKTTLLRRMLSNPDGRKLGVLVNDFGEINIDAALIVGGTADTVSLRNGCVCCTIRTELVDAVRELVAARPDLDRIVIEASGVSRSLPLADTLLSEELRGIAVLDGMFCLVDAAGFPELDFAATELAIDQITGADMILLTKTDLVDAAHQQRLHAQLQGLTPHLRIVPAVHGDVPAEILFGALRGEPVGLPSQDGRGRGHTYPHGDHCHAHGPQHEHGPECGCDHDRVHHTDAFASWSWQSVIPLDEGRLRPALRRLGTGLLRAKGLLEVRSADGRITRHEFQQVGKRSHLTRSDDASKAVGSQLVAIGLAAQVDPARLQSIMDGVIAADDTRHGPS